MKYRAMENGARANALAARLAEAEADARTSHALYVSAEESVTTLSKRLAEAERLLREAWDYWQPERIDAFLRPADSASAVACPHCGATDRHFGGCYYAGQRVALTVKEDCVRD